MTRMLRQNRQHFPLANLLQRKGTADSGPAGPVWRPIGKPVANKGVAYLRGSPTESTCFSS